MADFQDVLHADEQAALALGEVQRYANLAPAEITPSDAAALLGLATVAMADHIYALGVRLDYCLGRNDAG